MENAENLFVEVELLSLFWFFFYDSMYCMELEDINLNYESLFLVCFFFAKKRITY